MSLRLSLKLKLYVHFYQTLDLYYGKHFRFYVLGRVGLKKNQADIKNLTDHLLIVQWE